MGLEAGGWWIFSVKSCYKLLERLFLLEGDVTRGEEVVFGYL